MYKRFQCKNNFSKYIIFNISKTIQDNNIILNIKSQKLFKKGKMTFWIIHALKNESELGL